MDKIIATLGVVHDSLEDGVMLQQIISVFIFFTSIGENLKNIQVFKATNLVCASVGNWTFFSETSFKNKKKCNQTFVQNTKD